MLVCAEASADAPPLGLKDLAGFFASAKATGVAGKAYKGKAFAIRGVFAGTGGAAMDLPEHDRDKFVVIHVVALKGDPGVQAYPAGIDRIDVACPMAKMHPLAASALEGEAGDPHPQLDGHAFVLEGEPFAASLDKGQATLTLRTGCTVK